MTNSKYYQLVNHSIINSKSLCNVIVSNDPYQVFGLQKLIVLNFQLTAAVTAALIADKVWAIKI